MKVLVACEFSGIVRDAFIARGHDAMSCDLLPTESPGPHHQGDVREVLSDEWDLMVAHPPCTYLTCAGNKWFRPEYADRFPGRRRLQDDAAQFFMMFALSDVPRVAIENPIGVMSSRWRSPDQVIQPFHFGHPVRKSTCLWLKNLPRLRPTVICEPELDKFPSGSTQSKWHTETGHIKDPVERSRARSETFAGIAQAMADQWSDPTPIQQELFQYSTPAQTTPEPAGSESSGKVQG